MCVCARAEGGVATRFDHCVRGACGQPLACVLNVGDAGLTGRRQLFAFSGFDGP